MAGLSFHSILFKRKAGLAKFSTLYLWTKQPRIHLQCSLPGPGTHYHQRSLFLWGQGVITVLHIILLQKSRKHHGGAEKKALLPIPSILWASYALCKVQGERWGRHELRRSITEFWWQERYNCWSLSKFWSWPLSPSSTGWGFSSAAQCLRGKHVMSLIPCTKKKKKKGILALHLNQSQTLKY